MCAVQGVHQRTWKGNSCDVRLTITPHTSASEEGGQASSVVFSIEPAPQFKKMLVRLHATISMIGEKQKERGEHEQPLTTFLHSNCTYFILRKAKRHLRCKTISKHTHQSAKPKYTAPSLTSVLVVTVGSNRLRTFLSSGTTSGSPITSPLLPVRGGLNPKRFLALYVS